MAQRKQALVTGAGTGIGRSIAIGLAQAGFDVAVNYARSEQGAAETARLCEGHGASTFLTQADVSREDQVERMMEEVSKAFGGRLDVLYNNAGTTSEVPPARLETMEVEDFDRVFAVNVRGLFLVTKHATPLLRAAGQADIVNTASIVGLRPGPQPLPYSSSKAAIISMTQTLAGALGPNIRVNALAPGWMEGEWMQRTLGDNYERLMERRAKATPLKRCCTADDVGATAVALVTSMRFTTGQTIVIDGGYAAVN